MKRVYLSVISLAAFICTAAAQSSYGGFVLNHDMMMPEDFASLSQNQSFGTARSMAMAGAFTSLGADLASTGINPAGLGMYMSEEVAFTPMLSIARSHTTGQPEWLNNGNRKTTFGFSNMGASFRLAEKGRGSLISLTGSFTYNRIADYNSQLSFSSLNSYQEGTDGFLPSVADVFGQQLVSGDIYPSSDESMDFVNNPYFWPAQLGYKTFMLDPKGGDSGWTTNTIGHNASIVSSMDVLQRGRADEYSFGVGGNISNILYFGVSVAIQEITQSSEYTYQEEYLYDSDNGYAFADPTSVDPLKYQLDYSVLTQQTRLSGAGCNIKVGLIARPTRNLRVGVAYHSPTCYSLTRTYIASMNTSVLGNYDDLLPEESFYATSPEFIDNYDNSWRFTTPSKLLTGASLQFEQLGILSFDYERQWYNGIRVQNVPMGAEYSESTYKATFQDSYQATNTFRLGVEVRPLPVVAVRGGMSYASSMLRDENQVYSAPVATSNSTFSAGLGVMLSRSTTLDVTYQHLRQNYTDYKLFFSADSQGFISDSGTFDSGLNRNYIVATIKFKL